MFKKIGDHVYYNCCPVDYMMSFVSNMTYQRSGFQCDGSENVTFPIYFFNSFPMTPLSSDYEHFKNIGNYDVITVGNASVTSI